ncbi:MAG: hypothetical protein JO320_18850 [Alphaproteobacteria bacterium]|nr:hypothetical protein [Acetobacteraceae bacterium]MBV9377080.1 hypothetical protein [Alphaproteobacteria bacterium]
MRISVNIDCTPDEARAFFGLPDVKPMQDSVMARMQERMLSATGAMSPEGVMKTWLQAIPQNPEQMREMFMRFFAQPFGQAPSRKS